MFSKFSFDRKADDALESTTDSRASITRTAYR